MTHSFLFLLIITTLLFSQSRKEYSIGVQNFKNYAPYSKFDGENYSGFNRDIFDLFAEKYEYVFTYKARPYARLIREFLDGELDLIYPNNPYWNRDIKEGYSIIYSNPVIFYTDGVIVHKDNLNKDIEHIKELGTIIDFTPVEYLNRIENGSTVLIEKTDMQSLLNLVLHKRLDGAYVNIATSKCCLIDHSQDYKEHLMFNPKLPHTESYRALSTIAHKKIVAEFNEFLNTYSEEIDSLKELHHVHNQY